jgi:hypothetical protein
MESMKKVQVGQSTVPFRISDPYPALPKAAWLWLGGFLFIQGDWYKRPSRSGTTKITMINMVIFYSELLPQEDVFELLIDFPFTFLFTNFLSNA